MGMSKLELSAFVNADLLSIPNKPLTKQSALVTGFRPNGIGFAIGERFIVDGLQHLVFWATENSQHLIPFVKRRIARYKGGDTLFMTGDITDEVWVSEMMAQSYEFCGGNINILVNNAGRNINSPLLDVDTKMYREVVDSKALGTLNMTREWFRIRNDAGIKGGRVINIGTVIGVGGNPGQAPYELANGALVPFTGGRALEFGKRDITVNLINLGFVEGTDMVDDIGNQLEDVRMASPLGKVLTPIDAAGMASFLAGPDGDKITGSVLTVDAGLGTNYKALYTLHFQGYRRVPRHALSVAEDLTREEVAMIKDLRTATGEKEGQQ